ncbi:MAG: hypothetical protein IPK97_19435 [Ahniella sp.]|nr:hypothetical protein [Ahniella sp.]
MTITLKSCFVMIALALCSAAPELQARKPKSEISNTANGNVCFPNDQCVKVVSVRGARVEGMHPYGLAASSEWVTGVYDANGKVVGKVKTGGDVIVFSPEAYARRDAGQSTYTIHRIDGTTKPIKTPFVAITPWTRRIGWDNWSGTRMAAFGSTKIPKWSDFRDVYQADGAFGGIGRDGSINVELPDVSVVHAYGDYFVLAHTDGTSFSITDDQFRPLSPRLDNLALFTTAFDDTVNDTARSLGHASRRPVFAVKNPTNGGRMIYTLLPRVKGQTTPDGLIGLAPILNYYGTGMACEGSLGPSCRRDLRAWVGIWATADGQPVVSIEEPFLRRISSERYRAVHWYPYDSMIKAAVVETLAGDFQILPYEVTAGGEMVLSVMPERHASLDQANAALKVIHDTRYTELWNRVLADQQLAYQRYAAWEAQRAQEERANAERAAAEHQEQTDAQALIAGNDADKICAASWTAKTFYARTNLMEACSRLRPPAEPVSRGFWGDLAAGIAAYNRSAAGTAGVPSSTGSTVPSSSTNQGDFARSMQSIDSALRVISDPNWNGAAAAAQ